MKDLFIYNRMWSKKELFFVGKDNKVKNNELKTIKYKQMSFYTKKFQQPILYPILEINKYYPEFSQFNIGNINTNFNSIVKYKFIIKSILIAINIYEICLMFNCSDFFNFIRFKIIIKYNNYFFITNSNNFSIKRNI